MSENQISHHLRYDAVMIYNFFVKFLSGITTPKLPGILALVDFVIGQTFPISNFFVQQTIFYCRNETFSSGPVWSAVNNAVTCASDKFKPESIRQTEENLTKANVYPSLITIAVPIAGFVCGLVLRDKFQNMCELFVKGVFTRVKRS
jgi:hypothetical protein